MSQYKHKWINKKNEPAHDKTYNKTCATRLRSVCASVRLRSVFADRMCLLQHLGYSKRDKGEPLPYLVNAQADLSLCWSHRSYCRFCCALAEILFLESHSCI